VTTHAAAKKPITGIAIAGPKGAGGQGIGRRSWGLLGFFNWWDTRPTLTNLFVQIFRRSRNTRRRRASSLALHTITSQPHDFFNLFNHANFGFPDNWSSDAGFGQIFYQEQAPTSILGSD
jgi:hypothetical protein